jgi:hypothetical protein
LKRSNFLHATDEPPIAVRVAFSLRRSNEDADAGFSSGAREVGEPMSGDDMPRSATPGAGGGEPAKGSGAPRWRAPEASDLGDSIPGLRVNALAGVGGMSAVYRAEQSRLGRTVAVKILPTSSAPDPEARERFQREARILSGLNHPHILHIHDFGAMSDGTLYLVTEWADGGDLSKLIGGLAHPPAQVLKWVEQIAEALDTAHARGVVHRDLKPANVLVLEDGRLTLSDFGLAHAVGGGFTAGLTAAGAVFGTFEYMAPEQMESADQVTAAADIYALGVMTYQMLTGRVPRGAYARPSRISKVPAEVDAFLDSAMATDPARRPKSGAEFAKLFAHACRAPVRRRQRRLAVLGVTLVALALVWARSEIIRSERDAAAAAARSAAVVAELRLLEARRERAEAVAAAESARQAKAEAEAAAARAVRGDDPDPVTVETPPGDMTPETAPTPTADPVPTTDTGSAQTTSDAPAATVQPAEEKADLPAVPWTWVLPDVKPASDALAGEWKMVRGELVSGEERCALALPVRLAINYDVAIEFTRNGGENSIAVFVPTLSGVGAFEIDAWDLGIAGLQLIDGQDMRRTNRFFPARLLNGEKHRLILEVRGSRVTASWDGEPRMAWSLVDQKLRIPALWQLRPEIGLGIGSWRSPTTFHRIAYRVWPAEL